MANSNNVVVSIRMPRSTLRLLQLVAQVQDKSLGECCRIATHKYISEISSAQEFREKARALQEQTDEMLSELLKKK